jgi:predicted RND superfamily exporter protein
MKRDFRYWIIALFVALSIGSAVLLVTNLQFSFDFQQFFPKGDPDLVFFEEFQENFEADDNFLLVAIENKPDIFDSVFLNKLHEFTLRADTLPGVTGTQSITTLEFPVIKPPLFSMTIPAVHRNDASRLADDKETLLKDEIVVNRLISKDGTAAVIVIKNFNKMDQPVAEDFIDKLNKMAKEYDFDDYHLLGRANFQAELVRMQKRELMVSIGISSILTMIIMILLFQRMAGVTISMTAIGLSLLLFGGYMAAFGRTFTALSALYPVMMSIVATSDVVHFMSKYVDELRKGLTKNAAIRITIKEIGTATLLTSLTTAAGFASLMTSRIPAISEFGFNAAIGVLVAYVIVLILITTLLSFFEADQLIKEGRGQEFWEGWMNWFYKYTKEQSRKVAIGGVIATVICLAGISMITTNYKLESNLPLRKKITADYHYFEKAFAGFRPLEIAVMVQNDYDTDDYKVLKEIEKIENKLASYETVQNVSSITSLYKGLNRAHNANNVEAYTFPESKGKFLKYQRYAKRIPPQTLDILVSRDKKTARISSSVLDIGADNGKEISEGVMAFTAKNVDSSIIQTKMTGTSMMLDKNAEYIRVSLITGLAMAIVIVSILMAILFQNWRLVIISLVPNIFPLLIAGALLGYFGIELEAGVSVIFAVIFGIAVDDTIHFLSKFKLARNKGLSVDEALQITFTETGKAICLTTVILFFGFLVLLFSTHPPSIVVGLLIALTLVSALFSDLFLIPLLIRFFIKD